MHDHIIPGEVLIDVGKEQQGGKRRRGVKEKSVRPP
jgi:hypothetical protein